MFAPVESLPFGDRPVPERSFSAQRAGAADRAKKDPGRRPDRAGGVRRRAGRLRPRLRAHAGGARSARLPAGIESSAAAASDARDRGRGRRTRSSSRSAWRCAGGHTARSACTVRWAISCSCFCSTCPAQRTRVAGYDDTLTTEQVAAMMPTADARGRLAQRLLPRVHAVGLEAAGPVQPAGGVRQRPQHDDPERGSARLGQDDARPEAQVRGVPAGRAGDRLRPQGRPSLSSARGGRAAHRVRDAAPGPGAAGRARPAARGARSICARTPPCRFCATCLPGGPSRRGRRRWSAAVDRVLRRSREPTCLEVVRALRDGDEIDATGRQDARGLRALRA